MNKKQACTLFTLLFNLIFTCLAQAEMHANVFLVKGAVYLEENNSRIELKKNDIVHPGDTIVTMASSIAIIQLADGSKIKIEPKSNILVESLLAKIDSTHVNETSILIKAGSAVFRIENENKEPKLKVKTKNAAMGIRGTVFFAGFEPDTQNTWASVRSGELEFFDPQSPQDRAEFVGPNQAMIAQESDFFQPDTFGWQSDVSYDFTTNSQPSIAMTDLHAKHIDRIDQRKQRWQRNEQQYQQKKQVWNERRQNWQAKVERFKGQIQVLQERAQDNRKRKLDSLRQTRRVLQKRIQDGNTGSNPLNQLQDTTGRNREGKLQRLRRKASQNLQRQQLQQQRQEEQSANRRRDSNRSSQQLTGRFEGISNDGTSRNKQVRRLRGARRQQQLQRKRTITQQRLQDTQRRIRDALDPTKNSRTSSPRLPRRDGKTGIRRPPPPPPPQK